MFNGRPARTRSGLAEPNSHNFLQIFDTEIVEHTAACAISVMVNFPLRII